MKPETPGPKTPAPPDIVRAAYAELVVTDLARARAFYVDLLGFVVTLDTGTELYLRGYDELIHHNLILRAGPAPAAAGWATGCGRRPTWTAPRRSSRPSAGGRSGGRPGPRPAWGRPSGPRTRSASPSSSSPPRTGPSACSSATTCGAGPSPPGWTTSTSWSPTSGPPMSTTRRWASACPRRSRTSSGCTRPGCSASRACTTWRSPGETGRACTMSRSSSTNRTRSCGSATSSARSASRTGSNADPGGTACPTPSTSTCATRTATGSSCTPATTTPATPATRRCAGRSATRAAVTSGATRWSNPGTPRPAPCSTWTAARAPWYPRNRPPR